MALPQAVATGLSDAFANIRQRLETGLTNKQFGLLGDPDIASAVMNQLEVIRNDRQDNALAADVADLFLVFMRLHATWQQTSAGVPGLDASPDDQTAQDESGYNG